RYSLPACSISNRRLPRNNDELVTRCAVAGAPEGDWVGFRFWSDLAVFADRRSSRSTATVSPPMLPAHFPNNMRQTAPRAAHPENSRGYAPWLAHTSLGSGIWLAAETSSGF